MSGLTAGIRLAHFGKRVAILERHDRVGGLNSYYTMNGRDLDVGLHAITNFESKPGTTQAMRKILRQLRIKSEEIDLHPQKKSLITFPSASIEFSNEFGFMEQQVAEKFPGQADNFQKLVEKVKTTDLLSLNGSAENARAVLSSIISEPLLIEMLLTPLMFYGNSREDDMEFRQFAILFSSIFMEGIGRPKNGIRPLLDILVNRFTESGGELLLESGVKEIRTDNGKAVAVILLDGRELECDNVVSTAGRLETVALCPDTAPAGPEPEPGKISIMESLNILNGPVSELGAEHSLIFYNKRDELTFRSPADPVDLSSGVICIPDNFDYPEKSDTRVIRITNLANCRYWLSINPMENIRAKKVWHAKALDAIAEYRTDVREKVAFFDIFTPRTIERYTGHLNGAVYGAPDKVWSGKTPVPNIYLCGTDQGFLGIIGSMLSGITVANSYLLK
jgi:phytoene dehydrogenase-like protein